MDMTLNCQKNAHFSEYMVHASIQQMFFFAMHIYVYTHTRVYTYVFLWYVK